MNELTLSVRDLTIAAKSWGKSSLPPMLALHGWLDNANSFDLLAPLLSDKYHLIAIDLPGHGFSSFLPASNHYHFIDGIYLLADIIHSLGFEQVHLLGHSLGACLASVAAGILGKSIASLNLIEALGPFSQPGDTAALQLADYLHHRPAHPGQLSSRSYKRIEDAANARARRGHVSFDIALKLAERGVKAEGDGFVWRHDRRLLIPSPLRMTEAQVISCLKGVTAPTQLLWASNGFHFSPEILKKRVDAVHSIQCYQIEGGHHVHMESPEAVVEQLFNR